MAPQTVLGCVLAIPELAMVPEPEALVKAM